MPARVLSETAHSVAMLDAFPLTRGHSLVLPKAHREKMQDLAVEETEDLFGLVRHITTKVDRITGSTLVAIHNGRGAGQEIPHLHVHVVPRSAEDSAGPIHSMFDSASISGAELDKLHKDLRD